jgi:hypothetical protein
MGLHTKQHRGAQELDDMDMFELDAELESMTRNLPAMERAIALRSRHGLAPILEPDDDYDDFDASSFVERAYH